MGNADSHLRDHVVLYDSSAAQAAEGIGKFRNALKKGDKVVTIGGIYGEVAEIKDRTVIIKVDGETKLRVDKNSLVKDFSETQQQ